MPYGWTIALKAIHPSPSSSCGRAERPPPSIRSDEAPTVAPARPRRHLQRHPFHSLTPHSSIQVARMQLNQDSQQEMTTEQTMIQWKGEAEGVAEAEAEADRRTSSPHQQTPPLAPHAHITNITHTTSAFITNDSGAASEAGSVELAAEGGGKSGASVCSLSDAEGPRAHIAASDPLQIQIVLPTDEHAAAASADADSQQASRTESVSSAGVPPRAIPAALTGRSRRQSTVDSSRATASLQSYRSSHPLFDGRPYKEQQKAAKQFREELRSQASAAKSPALTAATAASTNTVTSSSMMGSMRVEQQAPEQVHEQEVSSMAQLASSHLAARTDCLPSFLPSPSSSLT